MHSLTFTCVFFILPFLLLFRVIRKERNEFCEGASTLNFEISI